MRVAVVGAGSIGAVLGAKLAATGNEVTLIARGAHLEGIRTRGLTLVDHVGKHSGTYRLPAGDDPAAFGAQDLIIIGLKAHAIAAMLPRMQSLIAENTVVVPAINGLPWWYFHGVGGALEGTVLHALDPRGSMFAALAPRHILGCVVHIAAEVRAAAEVHHTNGARIILGEPDGSITERLQRICAALGAAGFEAIRSTDIRLDIWTKLVGNLSFNPIAALTGYLMSEIVADDDVLDVIRAMMREGMQVAHRYGVQIPMTVEQRIDLARQLGAAKISMLQDLEQRRQLELDAIVGSVIELAERASVAVPTIRHVHALTQARVRALGIGTG
ncbi:MAG TPA: 2-dehydropantoate 2-reductase [Burkholderiaceae bacterium]|nr:2-dehydropantoate 2-reductase [Burkholderiaceae bacterium]